MSKTAKPAEAEIVTTEAVETQAETQGEQLIYLGPSKMGLINATVFVGGITKRAEDVIKAVPGARLLFVKIPDAAAAMADLRDKSSALSTIYEQVRKAQI